MKRHLMAEFATILVLCLVFAQWAAAANLIDNPGFESGTTGWSGFGCSISASSTVFHTGSQSGHASGRNQNWQGIRQSLLNKVQTGKTYNVSGWIMLEGAPAGSEPVKITIKKTEGGADSYTTASSGTGLNNTWVKLTGSYTYTAGGTPTTLDMYFEGPAAGVNYYLDDVDVSEARDWKIDANARIEQIRKSDGQITIINSAGQPVKDVNIQIEQISHDFAFGTCIAYWQLYSNENYRNFILDHFNWAVCENETKWPSNEPSRNSEYYTQADYIYNWCDSNGIKMRGHCLFWEQPSNVQQWVKDLSYATYPASSDLLTEVDERINSAMNHFKNKFYNWDVDNEMLTDSFYNELGDGGRVHMFNAAKAIDPNYGVFMNEYNGNSFGGYDSMPYVNKANTLIGLGANIDGFGLQAHLGGNATFEPQRFYDNVLTPLESFGKPIWITEMDASHSDVNTSANNIENLFRIAFSHPSVEGIIMWGFWQSSMWRSNAYLVDSNWMLTERGRRYETLMNEWTTNDANTTDSTGTVNFRGFQGDYQITISGTYIVTETNTLTLKPSQTPTGFVFKVRRKPVAVAGPSQTVYAWLDGKAQATLDGSASFKGEADEVTYKWQWVVNGITHTAPGVNPTIEDLPVGQHTIELVVNDGFMDSELAQTVVTVVAPIKGTLNMTPRTISSRGSQRDILAMMRLPNGITADKVDGTVKLILYPGTIEAKQQYLLPYRTRGLRRACIFAYFGRNDIFDALNNGSLQVQAVGKLKTGQFFYGSDKIKINNPSRSRHRSSAANRR